jgi:ElaB/YqjD/DUF883 family membrane-anchored ribosome-binding protein
MEITDKAANLAHEAGDRIANAVNQATETLSIKSEQVISAEQRLVKNCQRYVRDNPVSSLGIAVVAGFLLSRFTCGR